MILGLIIAGAAWRLSQGPVSIQFLLPYAEDLLERRDARYRAELDELWLTWAGWKRPLDIRALGVNLVAKDNVRPIVRIRELSVSLSVHALTEGKIAPTRLEIIRPRIRLIRDKAGAFKFDLGGPLSQPGLPPERSTFNSADALQILMNELSGPAQDSSSLRYLKRVSVISAALRLEDRQMGINWGARHADITVERAPVGLRTSFHLDLDLPISHPELHGEATFDRSTELIDVRFEFTRLNSTQLSEQFGLVADIKALAAEFGGSGNLLIKLDGEVKHASFNIRSGPGTFIYPGIEVPPHKFKSVAIDGRLNRNPDQIQIASAAINFNKTKAILAGTMTRVGTTAAVNATLSLPAMPVNDLKKFWPTDVASGVRAWMTTNMRDGIYRDATASLTARVPIKGNNLGKPIVDAIKGRMKISGVTIDYLKPMPPIKNVAATAVFNDNRFDVALQSGNVGDLLLDQGAVTISGIGSDGAAFALTASIQGPVRSALDVIGHPRLDLLSKVGLNTEGAAGTHVTKLELHFPLIQALRAQEISVKSVSDIKGLALANVLKGRGVTDAAVSLTVDNDTMTAAGTARYAGTTADFEWRQDFTGADNIETFISAKAMLNAKLLENLDLKIEDRIEGPLPIKLVYERQRNKTETFLAGLNLTDAKFTVPGFEWTKIAGKEATAKIVVLMKDGKVRAIPDFRIDAGDFKAAVKGTFIPDKKGTHGGMSTPKNDGGSAVLETLDIKNFILGKTSFSATVRRAADRSFVIDINGSDFNATPFISQSLNGIGAKDLPALRLTGTFGRFWIGDGDPTNNMRMELQRDAHRWQRVVAEATLPTSGRSLSIKMLPTLKGHILEIYSADAGYLLKALGMTDTIRTGIIEINGAREGGPNAPWRGIAEMKRFRVADAPTFARLLSLASFTGLNDIISGKGIAFSRLGFPYFFQNEVATIIEARAVGSELGITATGKIDFGKDVIDMNGTIIPAYTINSLLGKIPVIGTILTGEKGGGIFAASYKINGSLGNPKISVNPLSALAPGFLRKLLNGAGSNPSDGQT
ncbi:MAG: hypothetical protein CMM16_02245, partial [Rhodospirillaceae bacterium]|nr:hypothetical protein [Rhodospirillaceae bacterium]